MPSAVRLITDTESLQVINEWNFWMSYQSESTSNFDSIDDESELYVHILKINFENKSLSDILDLLLDSFDEWGKRRCFEILDTYLVLWKTRQHNKVDNLKLSQTTKVKPNSNLLKLLLQDYYGNGEKNHMENFIEKFTENITRNDRLLLLLSRIPPTGFHTLRGRQALGGEKLCFYFNNNRLVRGVMKHSDQEFMRQGRIRYNGFFHVWRLDMKAQDMVCEGFVAV